MEAVEDQLTRSANLSAELSELSFSYEHEIRRGKIKEFLNHIESPQLVIPEGLEWMNIASPLSYKDQLQGKIVILDFFTYCCINCMHVLPDLEALEHKFSVSDGVVVIGVHSAKFDNEKISANIQSAILRYDITHPVVNDNNAVLWQELQIPCWPTFVVVGPDGQFLHRMIGEGQRDGLLEFVEVALKFYKVQNTIKNHDIPLRLEKDQIDSSLLKFPGKISVGENGHDLAISDTGHHRVLIVTYEGIVQKSIGSGVKGFKDGSFSESQFNSPQGTAFFNNTVYVADTGNHAIRKVDLTSGIVKTVVGTGRQGQDKIGGNEGINQEISSPWDLCIGKSPGSLIYNILFIAMAGTHQIWGYFLEDGQWFRGKQYKAGCCVRLAGSGAEENRNNNYPEKAGFAQPSGIAWSEQPSHNALYIADSESSTVRCMSLKDGKDGSVKQVIGGERDPSVVIKLQATSIPLCRHFSGTVRVRDNDTATVSISATTRNANRSRSENTLSISQEQVYFQGGRLYELLSAHSRYWKEQEQPEACPSSYCYDAKTEICYRISLASYTASTAASQCQTEGGHLLRVTDMKVWTMIKTAVKTSPYGNRLAYFIDSIKVVHPGQWKYADGTTNVWLYWGASEPSSQSEKCLVMKKAYGYKFNDALCTTAKYFICQID